jgi:SAM-dependent methyltransferase
MKNSRDAYGAELMAAYKSGGEGVLEIIERDDRYIATSTWPKRYFSNYDEWSQRERRAASFVKGRVLDVGSGAGRYALYLQKQGLDVTAIDNSPGAVKVCRWRGVKTVLVRSISQVYKFQRDSFDTIIMMGSNFGLFGGRDRARRLLRDFHRVTSANGQIIAEAVDPYNTKNPAHSTYQRFNRGRRRMSGQLRIRVRHGNMIGPWFDYLLVSRKEMKEIVSGTGWKIARILSEKGTGYTVVLEKTNTPQWVSKPKLPR